MSNLSSIVNVTIQTITAGTPRESFGIPMVLSPTTLWAERVRQYTSLSGMVTDGFSTSDGEYRAAAAMFAQTPRPERVLIGRCANRSQRKFRLTPVNANSVIYSVEVDGQTASYTSDASATVAEITAGLKTAIDALAISGCTTTDNTTSLDISFTLGSTAHSVRVAPTLSGRASGPMSILDTTTDPGLAADLAAIAVERNDWYGIINLFNSKAQVDAIATYAESNEKLFLAGTCDSAVPDTALSGTDDVAEGIKGSTKFRTLVFYHSYAGGREFADASLMGAAFPNDTGSEKYSELVLAGVTADTLNATQRANIAAKYATYFAEFGGQNITFGGKVGAGEWADVIRARDGIKSDVQVAVFNVLSQSKKTGYTAGGIAKVQGAIKAALQKYVPDVLSASPAPVVNVPDIADVSTADKAARTLNGVTFDAVLTGAIYVTTINGTLSV